MFGLHGRVTVGAAGYSGNSKLSVNVFLGVVCYCQSCQCPSRLNKLLDINLGQERGLRTSVMAV